MAVQVVVTRAVDDAPPWVRALRERGHEVLHLPLLAIHASRNLQAVHDAWSRWAQYTAVMFVSGNAVKYFMQEGGSDAAQRFGQGGPVPRAWATGPGTSRALEQAGVPAACVDAPDPKSGQFDSEHLWQRVGPSVQPGQRVLIVRGGDGDTPEPGAAAGVGRDWLAAQLRASGALVDLVVAYERCLPVWTPERLSQGKMALLDGWTWLFSSSEAVANLGRLLPKVNAGSACALTTHARIAQAARVAGFGVVRESRPTLDDVLASIESPL